uniref:Uncharacterized protein n=1 Tax=Myotis myotis TaxID=51298 RepID=A0A7J7RHJ5_MYOMY|nr:hypothetical protein mMyoMyo1_010312 [Myotis myotis]
MKGHHGGGGGARAGCPGQRRGWQNSPGCRGGQWPGQFLGRQRDTQRRPLRRGRTEGLPSGVTGHAQVTEPWANPAPQLSQVHLPRQGPPLRTGSEKPSLGPPMRTRRPEGRRPVRDPVLLWLDFLSLMFGGRSCF